MAATLSLDNPVMKDFVFYVVIVVLKMMLMSLLTVRARVANKVFANKEDLVSYPKRGKVLYDFEPVERVRRNHLNDIENIIPFVLIGLCYVLSGPAHASARLAFRVFAGCRLVHTVAYQLALPHQLRGLAFLSGFAVTVFMGVVTLLKVL